MTTEQQVYRVGTLTYTKPMLTVLFMWLFWGDICFVLMEAVVPSIMPLKLQSMGASNTAMGLILTALPMSINTVFNPVISVWSDRHRSKRGRRIPFIIWTMPALVLALVALALSDDISGFVYQNFSFLRESLSPTSAALLMTAILMGVFSFFNTFVNSVFWYLFNDVVPEVMLARFMSWFRMVSMGSVALYNIYIFRYAGTHATEIMIGAALLYLVGFGLMCFNVREGAYPPPPPYVGGGNRVTAAVRTFGTECFSLRHYWLLFLASMSMIAADAARPFMLFFYQQTGLSLEQIGQINGFGNIALALSIPISGWFADRHHPLRIVIVGLAIQLVLAVPATLTWLVFSPGPEASYWLWVAISVGLAAPAGALIGLKDPTLLMRIFPRSRYGQFCSANAMLRSAAAIAAGLLVGLFLDTITGWQGKQIAYFCLPFWNMFFYGLAIVCLVLLYRSWSRLGGDNGYVPPLPETPARTGDPNGPAVV